MKTDCRGDERRKGERRSERERRVRPAGAYSKPERRREERRGGRDRRNG